MCFRSRSVVDIIPSQQCPSSLLLGLERATPPSEARLKCEIHSSEIGEIGEEEAGNPSRLTHI